MFLIILEKKTGKWVGFIRLGSPVINMRPRNEMLGGVFSQTVEGAFGDAIDLGHIHANVDESAIGGELAGARDLLRAHQRENGHAAVGLVGQHQQVGLVGAGGTAQGDTLRRL